MSIICTFFEVKMSVFAGNFFKYRIFFEPKGRKKRHFSVKAALQNRGISSLFYCTPVILLRRSGL